MQTSSNVWQETHILRLQNDLSESAAINGTILETKK